MSGELRVRNRQRTRHVNLPPLRRMIEQLLEETEFDLTVHLVGPKEMARLNQKHLGHEGPTDVITLDYSVEPAGSIAGEIFVCLEVAAVQAREFRTTWQAELMRYVIHGVLHLQGYDDLQTNKRRRMKRAENRLLKRASQRFSLSKLGSKAR